MWKERGFLWEVKPSAVEGVLKAYPRLIAARQIERTVASFTEHSPSERKMTTGDLWDLNHLPVVAVHGDCVPVVTPMLGHDRLRLSEGEGVICPSSRLLRHDGVQELIRSASEVVRKAGSW